MPAETVQRFEQMFRVSGVGPGVALGPAPTDLKKIDWLYSVLTILDNKARALLTFDGLLFTGSSLMYNRNPANLSELKSVTEILLLKYGPGVVIIMALVAALCCIHVAVVSYSFLGKITLGVHNNTAEIEKLGEAIEERTGWLKTARLISIGAVLVLIVVVVLKLFIVPE